MSECKIFAFQHTKRVRVLVEKISDTVMRQRKEDANEKKMESGHGSNIGNSYGDHSSSRSGTDSTSGNKVKKDYAVKEDLCDQQTQQSKAVSKVQS